jgi:hypothetical protein
MTNTKKIGSAIKIRSNIQYISVGLHGVPCEVHPRVCKIVHCGVHAQCGRAHVA